MFVVSPIVEYSIRRWLPTLPAITGPEFSPMPIRNGCVAALGEQRVDLLERRAGHLLGRRERAVGVVDLIGRARRRRP